MKKGYSKPKKDKTYKVSATLSYDNWKLFKSWPVGMRSGVLNEILDDVRHDLKGPANAKNNR